MSEIPFPTFGLVEGTDLDDFLVGKTCNPQAPEDCEACQ